VAIKFELDSKSEGTLFPHFWELCVGSCHAYTGLREDWRILLEKSHRELGFQYVRFHGLLDDDMCVCKRDADGKLRYSFFNIDSIFDFLLKIGMKPFIELGFMPEALASGATTCFHYKANVTPPADYEQWEALIRALTQHLVDRYGQAEVRTWFFEVWNEPNLFFFWAGTKDDYFRLYAHAVKAIKSVDNALRVGGPATSINAWIPDMIDFCRRSGAPLDFISTHHYPTDDPLWKNSELSMEEFFKQFGNLFGTYERGILQKMTARARAEAGDMPLYYTEWNTSAMLPDAMHDEAYSAALVAKTIVDNDGLVDGYSFWTFCDIFEEGGQLSAPFHGGFGLQTIHGIPKPTYRVFEMLHRMGNNRLKVEGGAGAEIHTEEISITLKGGKAPQPVRMAKVDGENANPKQKWIDLGSPEYPTPEQLTQIEHASLPTRVELTPERTPDGYSLHFTIPPHGIVALTLTF
jgi:xylan 1,4-beta-xylosidase